MEINIKMDVDEISQLLKTLEDKREKAAFMSDLARDNSSHWDDVVNELDQKITQIRAIIKRA